MACEMVFKRVSRIVCALCCVDELTRLQMLNGVEVAVRVGGLVDEIVLSFRCRASETLDTHTAVCNVLATDLEGAGPSKR